MIKVSIMPPPQSMPCSQYKWFLAFEDTQGMAITGNRVGALFTFVCKPTERQIRRKKKIAVRAIRWAVKNKKAIRKVA